MQGVKDKVMDRICKHCGFTYGRHHGGISPKDSGKFKRG